MNKNRIFDCVTFFDENLITNSRFEILNNVVDYFVVCESKYDHKGKKKKNRRQQELRAPAHLRVRVSREL